MGLPGFLAFQAYFTGTLVSALVHPAFYSVILYDSLQGGLWQGRGLLLALALINFAGGYAVNLALGALSVRGTCHRGLWPHTIFIPVYWLYLSAAAYRAVWQLIRAPFYWEKTEHGVSATLKMPNALKPEAHIGQGPARYQPAHIKST
jgi:hypothetical protein